ncbi:MULTISPECIES: SWIM zinc finger family protein [unclassified Halobacterium]|nr:MULTISPECIES: SWIM zinc finger family protein [unclassified Halobacterium]MCD2198664.1 SWIM zinc finger family protein [Halobacterium sp. KA-4]MCD2201860.1 SWIM zinc finger family protein [Halobacterium sp. KA-6]
MVAKTCTCPDWEYRTPEGGCKHLWRVDVEIKPDRVLRPYG